MNTNSKLSRRGGQALALAMAAITSVVVINASTTITVPNSLVSNYNLAAGAFGASITPPANVPVMVMGTQTAVGNRGVGHVSLLRTSVAPLFIEWTGIESPAGATITSGFSSASGTHIVFLDFAHTVDLEVNTASSIRVHNSSGGTATGTVTLIW